MLVWRCEGNFHRLARGVLDGLNTSGVLVSTYSAENLLHKVKHYCESTKVKDPVCLLLEAWNKHFIEALFNIFQLPGLIRRPRIVLLSSLLTWAGKRYTNVITDAASEFCSRRPIAASEEVWKTENAVWNIASKTKTEVIIIGFGLLYGKGGFDFAGLFR